MKGLIILLLFQVLRAYFTEPIETNIPQMQDSLYELFICPNNGLVSNIHAVFADTQKNFNGPYNVMASFRFECGSGSDLVSSPLYGDNTVADPIKTQPVDGGIFEFKVYRRGNELEQSFQEFCGIEFNSQQVGRTDTNDFTYIEPQKCPLRGFSILHGQSRVSFLQPYFYCDNETDVVPIIKEMYGSIRRMPYEDYFGLPQYSNLAYSQRSRTDFYCGDDKWVTTIITTRNDATQQWGVQFICNDGNTGTIGLFEDGATYRRYTLYGPNRYSFTRLYITLTSRTDTTPTSDAIYDIIAPNLPATPGHCTPGGIYIDPQGFSNNCVAMLLRGAKDEVLVGVRGYSTNGIIGPYWDNMRDNQYHDWPNLPSITAMGFIFRKRNVTGLK